MELYRFYVTVVLGLMTAAISNASRCLMAYEEDNGCVFYTATSDGNNTCYIHIIDKESDFAVRKSETLTEAILDFTLIKIRLRGKPKTERMNISGSIEAKWTRVQAISSGGGEPTAYVIGTEKFPVPFKFSKIRTYVWVRGSLHYTNDTKCFPDKLNLTTSQSTDTQYMNTTQSTESETATGSSEQWRLYVIIGVVIMIVALVAAVITAFQKRRKIDVDDATVLRHRDGNATMSDDVSRGPQIPHFYENTDGNLEKSSNQEEPIYEDPDLYVVAQTYENVNGHRGPVTCGSENLGGHPLPPRQGPMTERGPAFETENMLYSYIPGRDFRFAS